jgi:lipoate-protein ligase A
LSYAGKILPNPEAMRLIISENKDVYFNLALEDVLLHGTDEDILMLWQSRSAVVCGKHQNLCGEANYGYCKNHNIDLARRLSGGGTVYHDEGNVNFTFIQNLKPHEELNINFRKFLDPMMEVLAALGVNTTYSGRNDLLLDGLKMSGNAEHLHQQSRRVLHHGTLLFNSKLDTLGEALHSQGHYESKAVKSVRSKVGNIKAHTAFEHVQDFIAALAAGFRVKFGYIASEITIEENTKAQELKTSKYATDAWIAGYSPAYRVEKELVLYNKSVKIALSVQKGIISEAVIVEGAVEPLSAAVSSLTGKPLNIETEQQFFASLNLPYTEELKYALF